MTECQFKITCISDRQNLLLSAKLRQVGLEPYLLDRTDMFRFNVALTLGTKHYKFTYDVAEDGTLSSAFTDSANKELNKLIKRFAEDFFAKSPEYQQQQEWIANLKPYFEDGQYPGKDTTVCKHCGGTYKRLFVREHEHVMREGKILRHNGKAYAEIKKRGYEEPNWRPGISETEPSLEDLKKIKRE